MKRLQNDEPKFFRGRYREKLYQSATSGFEVGDILSYSYDGSSARHYRVLKIKYWEEYNDAIADLEDIETGEETSMNLRSCGLQLHQKAELKVFGWVQDKGQHGWRWRDITNTTGLQHIGENKYIEL